MQTALGTRKGIPKPLLPTIAQHDILRIQQYSSNYNRSINQSFHRLTGNNKQHHFHWAYLSPSKVIWYDTMLHFSLWRMLSECSGLVCFSFSPCWGSGEKKQCYLSYHIILFDTWYCTILVRWQRNSSVNLNLDLRWHSFFLSFFFLFFFFFF